jgi:hypothetical protein
MYSVGDRAFIGNTTANNAFCHGQMHEKFCEKYSTSSALYNRKIYRTLKESEMTGSDLDKNKIQKHVFLG